MGTRMTIRTAVITVTACAVGFAALGGTIGWALGTFSPGYYRAVFRAGNEPWFDPVAVGVGQGAGQGAAGGVAVGLALVALFLWHDLRARRIAATADPPSANW